MYDHEQKRLAQYEKRSMKPLKADSLPDFIFTLFNEFPKGSTVSTAEIRRDIASEYLSSMPSPQQITNALASLVKRGYLEKAGKNYAIKGERSENLEATVLSSNAAESFCRTIIEMIVGKFDIKEDKSIPAYAYDSYGRCLESSNGKPMSGIHLMTMDGKPKYLHLSTYGEGPEDIIETAFEALQPRYATGDSGIPISPMSYFKECTKINERYRKVFRNFVSQNLIRDMGNGHLALSLRCDWFHYADKKSKHWFQTEVKRVTNISTDQHE